MVACQYLFAISFVLKGDLSEKTMCAAKRGADGHVANIVVFRKAGHPKARSLEIHREQAGSGQTYVVRRAQPLRHASRVSRAQPHLGVR